MENGNTENYKVPEFVIKPYPNDKGFPLVKNNLKQSDWSLKKKNNKMIKSYDDYVNESVLLEAQQFFFTDELNSDKIEIQNIPGVQNQVANIKWSLALDSNNSGVESFIVEVKELFLKWDADEDLGKAGETNVDISKIDIEVSGDLKNLYAEQITYDNKTNSAKVRFGFYKEE